ncbi:hypothetical protein [Schaalia sp. ZJ1691]|uniref:hypothetical protein n=1 Tax=Schaalia sp. ZJ1691 TaxID=2709404 RepID=UPI0013EDF43C|nr:hypothetical protein [Schaalia sp. ZJ1691]
MGDQFYSIDDVRDALLHDPGEDLWELPADGGDDFTVFWRALRKGCVWFSRSSRVPIDEVLGWLWLYVWEHPQRCATKWNAAGEAGLVNYFSDTLFKGFPDYKHHKHEVPFGDMQRDINAA